VPRHSEKREGPSRCGAAAPDRGGVPGGVTPDTFLHQVSGPLHCLTKVNHCIRLSAISKPEYRNPTNVTKTST
jgi:hypothetical protein